MNEAFLKLAMGAGLLIGGLAFSEKLSGLNAALDGMAGGDRGANSSNGLALAPVPLAVPGNAQIPALSDHSGALGVMQAGGGLRAVGPVMAFSQGPASFVQETISGWRETEKSEVVAKLRVIPAHEFCPDIPASPGAKRVFFRTRGGGTDVNMWSYSTADLSQVATAWIKALQGKMRDGVTLTEHDRGDVPLPGQSFAYNVLDVAVTETALPVHLVLHQLDHEDHGSRRLFNMHLAEGAEVARVTILGGVGAGVANLDPSVPVTHITDEGVADCAANVPAEVIPLSEPASDPVEMLVEPAVEVWIQRSFGVDTGQRGTFVNFAAGLRAGPVLPPEAAPIFRPIAGAVVTPSHAGYLRFEGGHDWPEAWRADLLDLASRAVGGDPREVFLEGL